MKSIALTLLAFSAFAFAQGPDGKDTKPSDGAIKGGSLPSQTPRDKQRCDELAGTLREQCLAQEQERKAPAGSTRAPGEPPPQEPRQEKQ